MDEDREEPPTPGPVGPPEPPPPPPSAPPQPSLPPPAPPPAPPGGHLRWLPPTWPQGPRIEVSSVLGRTFDTFGREWSLFLALALPAGLGGLFQVLATPAYLYDAAARTTLADSNPETFLGDAGLLAGALIVSSLLAALTGLASMVATDRLWRGQETGVVDAIAGMLGALPRVIGLWLLAIGALLAVTVPLGLLAVLVVVTSPLAGALLLLSLAIGGLVVVVWVEIRLSLVLPVLLFEGRGVIESVRRTWRLTRGHMIGLLLTMLVVGLTTGFVLWGSSLVSEAIGDRLVPGIATAIGVAIASPLGGIWVVVAWGDLVGGRHADSPVMARGAGRRTALLLVVGFGLVLLMAGSLAYAGVVARTSLPG
jgi:hypothetical protein